MLRRFILFFSFSLSFFLQAQEEVRNSAVPKELWDVKDRLDSYFDDIEQTRYLLRQQGYTSLQKASKEEDDAMELYEFCYKKLNFPDTEKGRSSYIKWRSDNADKFSEETFRKAVKLQLQWLLFSLQIQAGEFEDYPVLVAVNQMKTIFSDEELMRQQHKFLNTNVFSTPVAKYYGFESRKGDEPKSPVDYNILYRKMMIPIAVENKNVDLVHDSWRDLIKFEELLYNFEQDLKEEQGESRSNNSRGLTVSSTLRRGGGRLGEPNDEEDVLSSDLFEVKKLPGLRWEYQLDLFHAGDHVNAVNGLVNLVSVMQNQEEKTKRFQELRSLVNSAITQIEADAAKESSTEEE